jgi:hypothetical protein
MLNFVVREVTARLPSFNSWYCTEAQKVVIVLCLYWLMYCTGSGIYIHLAVCLTTGPKPIPKPALHIVRSRASSFKREYPLLSLRESSSFFRLLPHLPVTSILPFIFPSITRCRRQFLRKMWPIQLAFRLRIPCRIFLCSLTLSNTSSFLTWLVQLIFSILLQHHVSKLCRCFWSTALINYRFNSCSNIFGSLYCAMANHSYTAKLA